jgi:hypothetical protein
MPTWVNHVAIAAPRNGTTSHTVDPNSGTVAAGSLFTPTAGRLLVCVEAGPVTCTTPSGWTLPTNGSAIGGQGVYVWWRTAAGSDTITTSHGGGNNYPIACDFYEYPAGSTFVVAARATGVAHGGANPSLSGLTGTNQIFFVASVGGNTSGSPQSWTWSGGTEATDMWIDGIPTDGYTLGVDYLENVATASVTGLNATHTRNTTSDRLTFAVNAAASAPANTNQFFALLG